MQRYAVLCGSAPAGFIQKKVEDKYHLLTSESGKALPPENVAVFRNGLCELLLEATLNRLLNSASLLEEDCSQDAEVLLYFCARSKEDLNAFSRDEAVGFGHLPVLLLGEEEIRKDVIAYYEGLSEELDVRLCLEYDFCKDFLEQGFADYQRES